MSTSQPSLALQFTERMKGFFSTQAPDDFEAATEQGKKGQFPIEFQVTITTDDLDRMLQDARHPGRIDGELRAPALSKAPFTVAGGAFNLFVHDSDQVGAKEMRYAMLLQSPDGKAYHLQGVKKMHSGSVLNLWPETTTLYVTLREGQDGSGPVVGRGVMHIEPADFVRQLTTIRVTGGATALERLRGLARFGRFFAGKLFETYGGVCAKPLPLNPDAPPRQKRRLDVDAPEVYGFLTSDNLQLRLTRYRGGTKGPVLLVHGLGVSSLIFAIDTIRPNLLEFLFAKGYDVWLLDYRASIDLPYAEGPYTGDDVARKDYPAAVAEVLRRTGAPSVQCVVHCYGATTFFLAMLAGLQGVRSAAVSQIACHAVVPPVMHAMAGAHVPEILDKVLHIYALSAQTGRHWWQRLEDDLLRFFPVNAGPGDINPVSRRISFLYGQLYELSQLNEATYQDGLGEMFGVAGIKSLEHLATIIRAGHSVDAQGNDVYLPNVARLAIPLTIVHGELNRCWLPESTERTLEWLRKNNDPSLYTRQVIPGYGHIDCIFGKNAHRDVFPILLSHLEKTAVV